MAGFNLGANTSASVSAVHFWRKTLYVIWKAFTLTGLWIPNLSQNTLLILHTLASAVAVRPHLRAWALEDGRADACAGGRVSDLWRDADRKRLARATSRIPVVVDPAVDRVTRQAADFGLICNTTAGQLINSLRAEAFRLHNADTLTSYRIELGSLPTSDNLVASRQDLGGRSSRQCLWLV